MKFLGNFRFWSNFRKISNWWNSRKNLILVTFSKKKYDFIKIFENFGFFRKFLKIRFLSKFSTKFRFKSKFRFWLKFAKISKNVEFSQIFEKTSILVKYPRKCLFWSNLRKISILVKSIKKNFDFGQNFRKILILVKMFEIFRFVQKFRF